MVAANNVFAHSDDLAGMAKGIHHLLADNGVFVFEVSYLIDVMEKMLFDTVYPRASLISLGETAAAIPAQAWAGAD